MPRQARSALERGVRADLRRWGISVSNGLAQVALELVEALDAKPGARDRASLARELRATMADLRGQAVTKPAGVNPLDQLAQRRAANRSSAASNS